MVLAPAVANSAAAAIWVWLAGAGIADAHLVGIGLGVVDQLLQRLPGASALHRDHRHLDAHAGDGLEVVVVERQLAGVIGREMELEFHTIA